VRKALEEHTVEGNDVHQPQLHRLLRAFDALAAADPRRLDDGCADDLDVVDERLAMLRERCGLDARPSPYLAFLRRIRPAAVGEGERLAG